MKNKPKIIVFAYSHVGYECLRFLLENQEAIIAVFTHENNPSEHIWFASVAELARHHQIAVYTPVSLCTPKVIKLITTLAPELIFSFYYRSMIPQEILDLAPLGTFNMHGSYLPKYRGRSPVNWAIIQGESRTGATLHWMVKSADAGDIVDQESVSIHPFHTAYDVLMNVTTAALKILERQLDLIKSGQAPKYPQDSSQATYFGGRSFKDNQIDWHQPAWTIHNLIRSQLPYPPYPAAFTVVNGRQLRILGHQIADAFIPCSSPPYLKESFNKVSLSPFQAGQIIEIQRSPTLQNFPCIRVACGLAENRSFIDLTTVQWVDAPLPLTAQEIYDTFSLGEKLNT